MSWNIQKPGDFINGPLTVAGSATITGDLTVDTSTLKVDSANDRVGIGTASPAAGAKLGVTGATVVSTSDYIGSSTWAARFTGSSNGASSGISFLTNSSGGFPTPASIHATPIADYRSALVLTYSADSSGAGYFAVNRSNPIGANTLEHYKIDNAGVATWSNVGGVASTAMTLNSTGLGVGASPSTRLHISNTGDVYARIATTSVSKAGVQLSANGVVRSHLLYDDGAGTTYLTTGTAFGGSGQALILQSGTSLNFYINNQLATANMTLDASGNLLVGRTTLFAQASRLNIESNSQTTGICGVFNDSRADAGSAINIAFYRNGTKVGSVDCTNAATSYVTSSDYRLKDDVQPLSGGLSRVCALKPSIYKWKINGFNGEGFIAHELAEVVPFAVTGEKDAVNKDGTVNPQGVDLSKLVPILVAAIQELTARVQTLEAK
jgi:hypothetical protein